MMKADTQFRLQVLSQMLSLTPDEILEAAVDRFVDSMQPLEREAFTGFLNVAKSRMAVPTSRAPELRPSDGRFKVTTLVQSIRFNDDSVRRRILEELDRRQTFTREEFNEVVATSMRWDPASNQFGVETTFPNPRRAAQQWWSTLKNRDHLIGPA